MGILFGKKEPNTFKELIKEKNKQGFTNKKYDTFFDGKVLQICFYSIGCSCYWFC